MTSKLVLGLALMLAACGGGADPAATPVAAVSDSAKAKAAADSAAAAAPQLVIDTAAAAGEKPLLRETYSWSGAGRDAFRPMLLADASGPELVDLSLFAIIYDASGTNSIAMFRESGTTKPHRLRQGQNLGRIYVAAITPNSVTLRVNDFGTVREQTYTLGRSETDSP